MAYNAYMKRLLPRGIILLCLLICPLFPGYALAQTVSSPSLYDQLAQGNSERKHLTGNPQTDALSVASAPIIPVPTVAADPLPAPVIVVSTDSATAPVASVSPASSGLPAPVISSRNIVAAIPANSPPMTPAVTTTAAPVIVQTGAASESSVAPASDPVQQGAYRSPDIIVHHEIVNLTPNVALPSTTNVVAITPQELAALAPAAGGDSAITPLIAIPADSVSMPPSTDLQVPQQQPNQQAQMAKVIDNALASTPPPPSVPLASSVPIPGGSANASTAALDQSLETPDTIKSTSLAPLTRANEQPYPLIDVKKAEMSEPTSELSPQSQAIASKIPGGLDTSKSKAHNVAIDHGHTTQYLNSGEEPQIKSHEATGVRIEVKAAKANDNYELEKAYNALISGHTEEAIGIYKTVLQDDPNNRDALFGLATTYHRAGQIDQARPLYGKLLALHPNDRDALNNFLVLLSDESPEAALEQLQKLQEKNPDFSPIPAQMAVIYQRMGYVDKASDNMFRAISLAPENLTYRYNLAVLLDKQGKYDEASKLYRQIIEASDRGEVIPGNLQKIQQRLTFISSNKS